VCLLRRIAVIFSILLIVIIVDLVNYNYLEKEDDIKEISSKMVDIIPAFSFTSNEYKDFVYDK